MTKKSHRKAPLRAGGRRAPLPWLMTHTITINGNHPSFHLYLKLFHIMSNQTKTTTDALVTQWELGTKTFIVTESQSLPIIISPLLFRCFEKNNQELLSPTPHNVVLNMQKNKQFKLFFNFNIFNKIILTCSFMQNKVNLHSFNGQYSFSSTANKVSSILFLSPHFPRNFPPAQSLDRV